MQFQKKYQIVLILFFSGYFALAQDSSNCTVLSDSSHEFIVYKTFCCAPPFFDPESGEGFFVNGTLSQPIPQPALTEIRNLDQVAEVFPILQFRIHDGERDIMIEGIDTKGIEKNEAILDSAFADSMQLRAGDMIHVKGQSYTVKEIACRCPVFPELDVYLTHQAAESLIFQGKRGSADGLMNLILVRMAKGTHHQQVKEQVGKIVGATAQIITSCCDNRSPWINESKLNSCTCGGQSCP
jgi:hypothetical protein